MCCRISWMMQTTSKTNFKRKFLKQNGVCSIRSKEILRSPCLKLFKTVIDIYRFRTTKTRLDRVVERVTRLAWGLSLLCAVFFTPKKYEVIRI